MIYDESMNDLMNDIFELSDDYVAYTIEVSDITLDNMHENILLNNFYSSHD